MGATQGELEQRLTHEEWTEWLRYRRVNPPDQARMDYRFGQLCAVLCAVNGNKDAKASDFIPDYRKAVSYTHLRAHETLRNISYAVF